MLRKYPIRMREFVSILSRAVKSNFLNVFILFTIFSFFHSATAVELKIHPDFKLGFNGRTYPIGAQIAGLAGASQLLWGDSNDWKYGFVRGALNLYTSAVVNRAGLELQFFPISIAGVTVGYDIGTRDFIPKWLDCERYACEGRVDRKHVRVNLFGAVKRVSFSIVARYEELRGFENTDKPLFDEMSLLAVKMSGENVFGFSPAVLYRLDDRTQVGFASLLAKSLKAGGVSHLYGPVVNWSPEPKFNALVGLGLNSAPVAHSSICGFFQLTYNVEPSLAVTDLAYRKSIQGVSESQGQ